MRRWILGLALAAAISGSASPVSAVAHERDPPFCDGGVVGDYTAPFSHMRKLHSPTPDGQIDFAPPSLLLAPLPNVLVGDESVGYTLTLRREAPPASAVHPAWEVTSSLSRVDRRGRPIELLRRVRHRVATVSETRATEVRFPVSDEVAFYRVTAVFRNASGERLGGYGFYFRVVSSLDGAGMTLSASSYRPGDIVIGRIDNPGRETAYYGAPFAIERPEGSTWIKAPESPAGPWIMPLYMTPPGEKGRSCSTFRIPFEMPPGRYRLAKEVGIGAPPRPPDSILLSAEFDVTS